MASLTLELPDDLLAEVSRLAQEFNVPRNDVFRRAIAALARAGELEAKMDRLSTLHAEAASYRQSLTTRMTSSRAAMVRFGQEAEELRRQTAAAAQGRRELLRQLSWLRLDAMRGVVARERLARERDAAVKARAKMEKTLEERTYVALNSLEVQRLQDAVARADRDRLDLAKRFAAQQAATEQYKKKAGALVFRLAKAVADKRELVSRLVRHKTEAHATERNLGRLRVELDRARKELRDIMGVLGKVSSR